MALGMCYVSLGLCCVALGLCCLALGLCCLALGLCCVALGMCYVSLGLCCVPLGLCCVALGLCCVPLGLCGALQLGQVLQQHLVVRLHLQHVLVVLPGSVVVPLQHAALGPSGRRLSTSSQCRLYTSLTSR